jgi:hypothetical protein
MYQAEAFGVKTETAAMRRVRKRRRVRMRLASLGAWVWVLAASAAGLPAPANAWENDVHYGMTWWLAVKVGFSAQHAEWIAAGNQGVDDSYVTGPVIGTAVSSCTATDASGSATVARNHFPSRVLPGADAALRVVTKGEPYWETRRAQPPIVDGTEPTLLALGRYLHSLQDTWSHQGKPDIPLSCDPKYAWGHALARGGWSCHLADLTHKWVESDVMPMAKATYDALLAAYGRKPKSEWKEVKGQVLEFARLDDKLRKAQWLQRAGVKNPNDVAFATSLQNCPGKSGCAFDSAYVEAEKSWAQRLTKLPPIAPQVPTQLRALLMKFGQAMIAGDTASLRSMIDHDLAQIAVLRALRSNSSCARLYDEYFKWALSEPFRKAIGAQQPVALCELAMQLQTDRKDDLDCSKATDTLIKAREEARPRGPDLNKLSIKNPFAFSHVRRALDDERTVEYWVDGYFPHLSTDRLLLGLAKHGEEFKVTAFLWQADE